MAEAATKTVLGKISQGHLECPICCCRFNDPKILDCLHSFCLNCLKELVSREQPKAVRITCPVCRRVTGIPDTGLQGLSNCFFLSSLIDEFNKQERLLGDTSAPTPTCEECEEGFEAVARCQDCDENICQKCHEAHKRSKHTKQHRLVTVDSINQTGVSLKDARKTGGNTPKCRKHTDHVVCFYCFTCEMSVCAKCAATEHRTAEHNFSDIADVVGSFRKDVDEILLEFENQKKQLRIAQNSIEQARNRLRIMVHRACGDICAKEEEEICKIRQKSRLLREKVKEIGQGRDGKFEEDLRSNRGQMEQAEQIIAAVNDLMHQADDFELLDLKLKIMHNLEFRKELHFEPARHGLSFLGVKLQNAPLDKDLGEILYEEKWHLRKEFGTAGKADGEFKLATDVCCFNDGRVAVTDLDSKNLSVLTSAGLIINSSDQDVGKLEKPFSAAVTCENLLLVTDGEYVKVLDENLQVIRKFKSSDDDEESILAGVAVDKKNRVAVADRSRKVISLHNLDGSLIRCVSHDLIDAYLAISDKERLIFTNNENRRLVCIDFTGTVVFNVGTSIERKVVKPIGVCCDCAGDIYVSTYCDRTESGEVHHYDSEGVYIGCVARELLFPFGMSFTATGELAVADTISVKIFQRV